MKTWKFKQIQRQSIAVNGFYLNHSFVQIQKKREWKMIHITLMNLQLLREEHHQNIKPHGYQTVLQKPGLSLAKNAEIECTMICQSNPKCPTP